MALTYIDETHQYFDDGIELPSVTQLVAPLGDDIDKYIEDAMEAAAERGTTCHKVIELMLSGEIEIEYPSAYEPYVEAIRALLAEHEIIPIAIETPICGIQTRAAGTPDLLCYFDGVLTILDYKFVAQVAKAKVKAQLNGYRIIEEENGVFPEQLIAIQFLNTGKYRPYITAIDDTEFKLCYQLYELKNKKHPRGRIE